MRAKGIINIFPFLEEGGSSPASPTQIQIRIVLLYPKEGEEKLFGGNVSFKNDAT